MSENEIGICPFQTENGEEILAHDGTRFSEPFFLEAKELLSSVSSLDFGVKYQVYPANYEEDLVQAERRRHFDIGEWIVAAMSIDEGTAIGRVLLIDRHHHQEGYVVKMMDKSILASFYRGFSIKESSESPLLFGEEFLLSIGFKDASEDTKEETPLFFEPDEEGGQIFAPRPVFEATGKKRILNLGSSETAETEVREDEEGDLHIEVERSSFEAGGQKKPKNLGSAPKSFYDDEEDVSVSTEVSKPSFEARANKKPRNLNATPDRPRKTMGQTPIAVKQGAKPVSPSFEPLKKASIANLDEKPSPSIIKTEPTVYPVEKATEPAPISKPAFVAEGKKNILNFDRVVENENREWSAIDVYKLRPDVYRRERAILNDTHDENSLRLCQKVRSLLGDQRTLPVSSRLLFVPSLLGEGDPHFRSLRHFDIKEWDLLAITVDFEDDPLLAMISKKDEASFALIVSFRKEILVEVMSLQGAALDDRALPYLSYAQLRKIVLPD